MNIRKYFRGALALLLVLGFAVTQAAGQGSPNVVMIVADDAGFADWGFMDGVEGSGASPTPIPTPSLDALASRGVRFSRAYVAQSCQPTRAALVTGGYQNRIGNEVVGNNYFDPSQGFAPQGVPEGVPAETTTIWERMKSQGYSTAAVGKWHLGQTPAYIDNSGAAIAGNRPEDQGVDEFFGIWHGSRNYNIGGLGGSQTQRLRKTIVGPGGVVTDTNEESTHSGEYFTNTMGDYAVDFISRRHNEANPFFLYQSFTAPHTPLQDSPDINDPRLAGLTGIRKTYASMMLTMEKEIGRILDRLEDPDGNGDTSDSIADNTLIIFVNDNGGAHAGSSSPNGADNGVLRAGKGSSFEGGIRVPMIIAGAGVNQAVHGTTYDKAVHGVDLLPTAFAAAGGDFGPADDKIDGVDLLPFINGTNAADPHEVIVHRHRKQFAVIKGDWRLVNNGGSSTNSHQLYNIETDIDQSSNVAGSNPAIVAELQRDLTDHEAVFDKQRYEILGNENEETINVFDHFGFRPDVGLGSDDLAIIDGPVGNGDFEADSGDGLSFAQVTNWHNIEGSDTGPNFGTNTGMLGSPQPSSQGAFLFGQAAGNDTGFTITAAGQTFDISLALHRFGGGYNGDEVLDVTLFTTSSGVDADTTVGDITVLGTTSFPVSGTWTSEQANDFYTSTAADVGKTVYLGLDLDNPTGNNVFPRIDVVELTVSGAGGPSTVITNWSKADAWFEGETNNVETMFNSDAFAGAVLEFGTSDDFSYISNNDMVRETGLEFMLNKIVLSGSFGGDENQSATIQGNDLLFTKDLDGVGPHIVVHATNSGEANYSYSINLNVLMHGDLTITGDGDTPLTINGQIRDYFHPRNLIKSGASTLILTANNTHAGDTTIAGGTLAFSGGGALSATPNIEVQSAATLDVSATTAGGITLGAGQKLSGSGSVVGDVATSAGASVSPGSGIGRLTVNGDFSHATGGSLIVELGPGGAAGIDYDQLLVNGDIDLLDGDLTVSLEPGFMPSSGDDFHIVDFTTLSGAFGSVDLPELSGGLAWNLRNLLTTGSISVILPGDYNDDGAVDAIDYAVWRENLGAPAGTLPNDVHDGVIGSAQFATWKSNFGATGAPANAASQATPEPTTALLMTIFGLVIAASRM